MPLPQRIGFIGRGAVADVMVRGLRTEPAAVPQVVMSQRSADVSAKLAADFLRLLR